MTLICFLFGYKWTDWIYSVIGPSRRVCLNCGFEMKLESGMIKK